MRSRYRAALRAAISSESKAYGFSLVVWGAGALALSARGNPGRAGVVAFVGGSLVAMGAVIVLSFGGPTSEWTPTQVRHLAWGAVHLGSVAGALAAGWLLAEVISIKWIAYLAAGAVATLVYQLLLGLEVAITAEDGGDN